MSDDPQYVVLGAMTESLLGKQVEMYLGRGYVLAGGGFSGRDGRFHQAVVRRPSPPDGEIRLREPKRK